MFKIRQLPDEALDGFSFELFIFKLVVERASEDERTGNSERQLLIVFIRSGIRFISSDSIQLEIKCLS